MLGRFSYVLFWPGFHTYFLDRFSYVLFETGFNDHLQDLIVELSYVSLFFVLVVSFFVLVILYVCPSERERERGANDIDPLQHSSLYCGGCLSTALHAEGAVSLAQYCIGKESTLDTHIRCPHGHISHFLLYFALFICSLLVCGPL